MASQGQQHININQNIYLTQPFLFLNQQEWQKAQNGQVGGNDPNSQRAQLAEPGPVGSSAIATQQQDMDQGQKQPSPMYGNQPQMQVNDL